MPGDGKANQLAYQLSGEVIDNVQYPKTSAIAQLVCHKVHRPALVRGRWDLHGKTGALELLAFLGSDLKTLLTIEAIGPLLIDHQPFAFEQAMQQQVAVASIGARQDLETGSECIIRYRSDERLTLASSQERR